MNQLGDLLFSLPVLTAARATWPEAHLTCVARSALAPLIKATGVVDDIVVRQRDSICGTVQLINRLRKTRFERAIFFSESPGTLMAGIAARIPVRVGFDTASLSYLLTVRASRIGVPSLSNNRSLAVAAGIRSAQDTYCDILKISAEEKGKALQWLSEQDMKGETTFILAPGASRRRMEKHWKLERWQELARRMQGAGSSVVAVGAPREKEYLAQVTGTVYAPDNGLIDLAALMSISRAVVSIDSGAMHLGAALGKPVVALYGPTDPSQIGPQPLYRHQVIKHLCMDDITVEEVWKTIQNVKVDHDFIA